jgi:hypothetical protein
MSLSAYEISIPPLDRGLGILRDYLDVAEAFAREKRLTTEEILGTRLAPDMLTLHGQVEVVCNKVERYASKLAQQPVPEPKTPDVSFEALRQRIVEARKFLEFVPEAAVEGAEAHIFELSDPLIRGWFGGTDFILQLVLPDFFFHIATTHDILRHLGAHIGKRQYIGNFELEQGGYK